MPSTTPFSDAKSLSNRATWALSSASSPASLAAGRGGSGGDSCLGVPLRRCAQRFSRAPGRRGNCTTSAPAGRAASSCRKPSTAEMSAKACSRSQLMRSSPDGLRPAQHQRREDRNRLRRNLDHALEIVRVAGHAPAARLDHQVAAPQAIERRLHLALGYFHHGGRGWSSGCSRSTSALSDSG